MNDSQTTLLILAALPGVITGLFAGIVSIITARRVAVVKQIVDGPLSVALKSNKELANRIAELTGKHEDLVKAAEAQIIFNNREEGKEAVTPKN